MEAHASDQSAARKSRGAFFTPPAIADYLAEWAVDDDPSAKVLDPSCGESVFLSAAATRLKQAGTKADALADQVYGVDIEAESVLRSKRALADEGLGATLLVDDFFQIPPADGPGSRLPQMDAVIGNPPFLRYHQHAGASRAKSAAAALAQGVQLSGLASSWAAMLVHACSFLKPDGRLAMVLPAELLTVGYAEPIRRWLRQRFGAVHLIMFERLQFDDAQEKVVLVIARGSGGCEAFSLLPVENASDLAGLKLFGRSHFTVAPADSGKWTDLLLPIAQRQTFKRVADEHCVPLRSYGATELGAVTGANKFFTLSESTRKEFELTPDHLVRICPPGTRHLKGLSFSRRAWERLRDDGEAVWMLHPSNDEISPGLRRYLKVGEDLGVPEGYKCRNRNPWWRPPVVAPPDLFFTYMSHRYPRLIRNSARVSFVNSMHGVRLSADAPAVTAAALPLLVFNSVSMLGAEIHGRSYGGGVLKMEPSEAASLPVPGPGPMASAFERLKNERASLSRQLESGRWTEVVQRVDEVLLEDVMGLSKSDVLALHDAAVSLRERRIGRDATPIAA